MLPGWEEEWEEAEMSVQRLGGAWQWLGGAWQWLTSSTKVGRMPLMWQGCSGQGRVAGLAVLKGGPCPQ